METQTNTTTPKTTPKTFTRKARLGVNPITLEEKQTRFFEITSDKIEKFERANDEPIDYVMVTDMSSGEEGHFWLSGQLRYQLSEVIKTNKTLKGFKVEITHKGQTQVEILNKEGKNEKVKINQYDMYELN